MKIYPVNPLALLGMSLGYNRPLDRHDFPHGSVPDRAGLFIPGMGELRRFANLNLAVGSAAAGRESTGSDTTQQHPLGTIAVSRDGRVFRYTQVGATATVAGSLYQTAAPIANHLANTPPAVAIGATSFIYTPGATAGAANLYAEGYLQVDTTPGNGYMYRVSGHAAISASTAFTLFLDPDDPIQIALTTSSRVGLLHNRFKNVIVHPTTATGTVAGFAISVIAAASYGWLQTRGPVAALIDGTPGVGIQVVPSNAVAGAVEVAAVAAEIETRAVGHMMQVGVDTKNNGVWARLD